MSERTGRRGWMLVVGALLIVGLLGAAVVLWVVGPTVKPTTSPASPGRPSGATRRSTSSRPARSCCSSRPAVSSAHLQERARRRRNTTVTPPTFRRRVSPCAIPMATASSSTRPPRSATTSTASSGRRSARCRSRPRAITSSPLHPPAALPLPSRSGAIPTRASPCCAGVPWRQRSSASWSVDCCWCSAVGDRRQRPTPVAPWTPDGRALAVEPARVPGSSADHRSDRDRPVQPPSAPTDGADATAAPRRVRRCRPGRPPSDGVADVAAQ